ncbi:MAG: SDR family NAD(P)-dependent oxidoreductase [Scytonema sp. PMC 1069.18]|nr:SDR family NAD(P)-dependent oxidoreductase [Scytonema sp. PMC 1069.18]MEC4881571.1 SDR family NAD(P)-dependent oxidoreductase [Scytonema sp. PMC 1070.18]
MISQFQGKYALVTGGNKGIGFAICKGLLDKGFEVIVTARSLDKAKAAAEQLRSANSKVHTVELDVTDDQSIHQAAKHLSQKIHHLDVSQAFLPLLEKAKNSRIINVSSGYGQLNGLSYNVPSYCLSKLTLNGVNIMLADALKEKGIAVYTMSPGWVRTDMGGGSAPRSPEQGADTAIWLATEAALSLSGKFFQDRKEISY